MYSTVDISPTQRYQLVTEAKAAGATYTPSALAEFVAARIVEATDLSGCPLHVLDPAVGDGELLLSLLEKLAKRTASPIVVHGFDTNVAAVALAQLRLAEAFPQAQLHLEVRDFLAFASEQIAQSSAPTLFTVPSQPRLFDIIIANPPYVRTQILGAEQAQSLALAYGLNGRIDLYHAFLIAMAAVLKPTGTAGIIVSNRFMTTKGGASLRAALRARFELRHIWDLGDTKLFDAAVLPAVILAQGRKAQTSDAHALPAPAFTSIYATEQPPTCEVMAPLDALEKSGIVGLKDGRRFRVQHGTLDTSGEREDLWRIATDASDTWLATVAKHTWKTFGGIGKIRVGVKTCADKIFIRKDWDSVPEAQRPELLRPLTTHHMARRFRALPPRQPRAILYPHESTNGQRQAVDLSLYPRSQAYLEAHRTALEARTYVMESGRRWYELWVPQDPAAWQATKLVFRDISERPTFWIDLEGSIVNGDCYWMTAGRGDEEELLWLAAAVANSTFIEAFYDHCFNNKLYAGRRRFITQYVEQFPLPDPHTDLAREIVRIAKTLYEEAYRGTTDDAEARLDRMIWSVFGLGVEEVAGERNL